MLAFGKTNKRKKRAQLWSLSLISKSRVLRILGFPQAACVVRHFSSDKISG